MRYVTHFVVATAGIVEHRVKFDVLQVYLQIVVARLALVELDRGAVHHQRHHRQHRNHGAPPLQRVHVGGRWSVR